MIAPDAVLIGQAVPEHEGEVVGLDVLAAFDSAELADELGCMRFIARDDFVLFLRELPECGFSADNRGLRLRQEINPIAFRYPAFFHRSRAPGLRRFGSRRLNDSSRA